MDMNVGVVGLIATLVVMLGFFVWMFSSFYKKCPPNMAMIISGMLASDDLSSATGTRSKVVVGGGTVVFPVIQNCSYLSLEAMAITLDPQTPYVTKDGTQIKFKAVAQVKVKSDPVSILTAAELFLGKKPNEIAERVSEIIIGHTRALVGTMTYNEILQTLNQLSLTVREASLVSLMSQGMTVVSYSIDEMENSPAQLQSLIFEQAMKPQT